MKEVKRPWGDFEEFVLNKKCTVKILTIKPRQRLSLQYHNHREEMWYFLDKAIVQIGKKKIKVKEGSIIKIKPKVLHRAIALNNKVKFLEVSLGKFSEKDEVKLEDKYGRK
jgi:mannose-6-phosphate isomerase